MQYMLTNPSKEVDDPSSGAYESFHDNGTRLMKIIVGLALAAASAGLWALDTWRSARSEAVSDYVSQHARQWTPEGGMQARDGDLVVAVAVPLPSETLVDDVTGFRLDVLRLERDVEIYQWKETAQTSGDGSKTIYTYDKVWTDRPVESSLFAEPVSHRNGGFLPFGDRTFKPTSIRFGEVVLDPSFAGKMGDVARYDVTREMYDAMPDDLKRRFAVVEGRLFPNRSPKIGDVRITWHAMSPRQATVVGEYRDGRILPAETSAGTVSFFHWGNIDVEKVVELARDHNRKVGVLLGLLSGLLAVGAVGLVAYGIWEVRDRSTRRTVGGVART